jgi:Transglutaminase-like enzymes, putative cysteine proteases
MQLVAEFANPDAYLADDAHVGYRHPAIIRKADELFAVCDNKTTQVVAVFEFVRDRIAHSFDIGGRRVTRSASKVLLTSEGICYAKSMLLAALLRSCGIPTGFCYQRLRFESEPDLKYCVHALNAVYLDTSDGLDAA